jgi:hypothetical protein
MEWVYTTLSLVINNGLLEMYQEIGRGLAYYSEIDAVINGHSATTVTRYYLTNWRENCFKLEGSESTADAGRQSRSVPVTVAANDTGT